MKVQFIAIAGGSGSGKTWLSHRLASHLGSRASLLSLDDFYQGPVSVLTPSERRHVNFDHPAPSTGRNSSPSCPDFNRGRRLQFPEYDFTVSNRSGTRRRMRPAPLILVDGLWPFRQSEHRDCIPLPSSWTRPPLNASRGESSVTERSGPARVLDSAGV